MDEKVELQVDEELLEEIYGKSALELERKRYKVISSQLYEFLQVTLLLFCRCNINWRRYKFYDCCPQ
jgi:hypothetical protein